MLERYLDNLTSYAETVIDTFSDGSDGSRPTSRPGSSGRDMVPQTRIESIESEDILQPGPGPAFPAPPKEREHIQRVSDARESTGQKPYLAPPKEREHIQRVSDFEPYPAPPKEREHIQRASDAEKSTGVDRLAHTVLATHTKRISGLNRPSKKYLGGPLWWIALQAFSRDSKLN